MSEDLYRTLGVGPDATQEEIKAAHRKRARKHHPDAGGDVNEFHAVQRAYGILSDSGRREEYDRTGRVAETDPVARRKAQAMTLVAMKVSAIVQDPRWNIATVDVIGLAREQLADDRTNLENRIAEGRAVQKRYTELLRRLKRQDKPGVDNLRVMAEGQIQTLEGQIAQIEDQLQVVAGAAELVGEYVYEHDSGPMQRDGWVFMGRPSTAWHQP